MSPDPVHYKILGRDFMLVPNSVEDKRGPQGKNILCMGQEITSLSAID